MEIRRMTKFRTFKPYTEYDRDGHKVVYSATIQVNEWLEENQDVEIISWQTTAIGNPLDLWITVQYKEED
jgi:hypothetical protein